MGPRKTAQSFSALRGGAPGLPFALTSYTKKRKDRLAGVHCRLRGLQRHLSASQSCCLTSPSRRRRLLCGRLIPRRAGAVLRSSGQYCDPPSWHMPDRADRMRSGSHACAGEGGGRDRGPGSASYGCSSTCCVVLGTGARRGRTLSLVIGGDCGASMWCALDFPPRGASLTSLAGGLRLYHLFTADCGHLHQIITTPASIPIGA